MQLDPLQVGRGTPGEAFSDFVTTWQSCKALQLTPQDKQRGASITALFDVTRNPNTDCSAAIGSFVLEKRGEQLVHYSFIDYRQQNFQPYSCDPLAEPRSQH